jgi:hypothetical protein
MELSPDTNMFQTAMDSYLDIHMHTDEAYTVVTDVLNKWEFMVKLATSRAIEELFYTDLPSNVIPLQPKLISPYE